MQRPPLHRLATACAVTVAVALLLPWLRSALSVPPPLPPRIDLLSAFTDARPVAVTLTVGNDRPVRLVTVDDLRNNVTLWRGMHVADWNGVPGGWREPGLDRMLQRYRRVLANPAAWDDMTAEDWDVVPQPIRTVAFRQMAAYWAGYYDLGRKPGTAAGAAANVLAAIVMSESWFDHRATYVNRDGSRDIGLGGASDFARRRLRELREAGLVDIGPRDGDYWNPWVSTRFVAVWMSLLLDEAGGDLELAIRAYNRGLAQARDSLGDEYYGSVMRRLNVFIRNRNAPPAWDYLWRQARAIERRSWPWIAGAGVRRGGRTP